MSHGISADGTSHEDVLDWLHEQGKQRAARLPDFDVERTLARARAARDAGAVNFWTVLNLAERSAFEAIAREQTFPAGTALMREGDQAEEVMVILDGWTKVAISEDGREVAIAERGPGDLVGESGTAPGNVRSASVIALEEVRALVMTTEGYAVFISEFPSLPDVVKRHTYDRLVGRPDRF
jgi:CRP-like cAMP-binding protein